ncbi:MAG: DUF47 family protein, partial [Candidatus Nitrosopelagicus sp.]|nr:DUF47 family protein [Candidatus Nitrosopelagicus sp.]
MGQFFSWVKSNEKAILVTLDELAKKGVEVSEAVVVMLTDLNSAEHNKIIHSLETEADALVREIFSELNRTFITPLDREDMQRVASKIDDTIDHMDGIASRLYSYKITTTPPYALEIANELVNATKEVEQMTSKLRNIKNPSSMIEHCRRTSEIEHTVDDLYKSAMTKLFESN